MRGVLFGLAMLSAASSALGSSASAAPALAAPTLSPAMQPLGFLVGHWTSVKGEAENGAVAKGVSNIEPAASGTALLRRDRTDLFNQDGTPRTSFEQVMMIYPDGGALHGDYFDGEHVIHYVSAKVDPGKSVSFDTADALGPPRFRLTYTAEGATKLAIKFEIEPPGAGAYQTIAVGEAKRD